MKRYLLLRILFFCALATLYYYCFPNFLLRIEEAAFYIDTPDYTKIYFQLPNDIFIIIGNYISQFYQEIWVGALIHSAVALLFLVGVDVFLYELTWNRRNLYLSFIITAMLVGNHFETYVSGIFLTYTFVIWMLAIITWIITKCLHRPLILTNNYTEKKKTKVLQWGIPIICIILLCSYLYHQPDLKELERRARIEHYAWDRQWDKILEEVPQDYMDTDEFIQQYALLALSEKGVLGEYFFHFPRLSADIFIYNNADQRTISRYNALFFWLLDAPNEALRYIYEGGQYDLNGMTFETLRNCVEWNLEKGERSQAEYYLNILEHSSCHDTFVRTRRIFLNQVQQKKLNTRRSFYVSTNSIVVEANILLELNPENKRPLDIMLCGLLAEKDLENFYQMFCHYWNPEQTVPTHYQEALLMLADKYPAILSQYKISPQKKAEYQEFKQLVGQKEKGIGNIEVKYRHTFWRYMLFAQKKSSEKAGEVSGHS